MSTDRAVTYIDYLNFCKKYYLDSTKLETHFSFICFEGLVNDAVKLIDTKKIPQQNLYYGLYYAAKGKKANMLNYLLKNKATFFGHMGNYKSAFYEMICTHDMALIANVLNNFSSQDFILGKSDMICSIFGNMKLLNEIIKNGFNINIHQGVIVNNYYDRSYTFKYIIGAGGDLKLLTPESIEKIKKTHDPITYEYTGGYQAAVKKTTPIKKKKDTVYALLISQGIIKE